MEQYEDQKRLCAAAGIAARPAGAASGAARNEAVARIADRILSDSAAILEVNRLDIENAGESLPKPVVERFRLDESKINALCDSLLGLMHLPDPVGAGERIVKPSGTAVTRIRVPLGTVAFICGCRPELVVRAAALAVRTGNAAVICGGLESAGTDAALIASIRQALNGSAYDPAALLYIDPVLAGMPETLAAMSGVIDLIIHFGDRDEVNSLSGRATVPVIASGQGNCHIYIDAQCDIARAVRASVSAAFPRRGTGNTASVLLVHKEAAPAFLPSLRRAAQTFRPEYRACPEAREFLPEAVPAVRGDWSADNSRDSDILAVKVVESLDEAVTHINTYGTGHCDAIMTASTESAGRFLRGVDSRSVCVNSATRLYDDAAAAMLYGVPSQHRRLPSGQGLEMLTTEKYIITGADIGESAVKP